MTEGAVRDGLLPVDKPTGPTSHDVVARARRALGIRRVGHTGTLDPFASGLLLLLLGNATRLAEYFDGFPKEYVARARLGERTSTDDPEGEVTERSDEWRTLDRDRIAAALASFRGDALQEPPAYSAKKVGGRPAHRLRRAGTEVALPPVPVTIHEIVLEELSLPELRFRVRCSTGTYIRAIARDLGEQLGVGGHLVALRRVAIGPFRVEEALPLDRIEEGDAVSRGLRSPLEAVGHLPRVEVDEEEGERILRGQSLSTEGRSGLEEGRPLALASGDRLLAVAEMAEGRIHPRKVFPLG